MREKFRQKRIVVWATKESKWQEQISNQQVVPEQLKKTQEVKDKKSTKSENTANLVSRNTRSQHKQHNTIQHRVGQNYSKMMRPTKRKRKETNKNEPVGWSNNLSPQGFFSSSRESSWHLQPWVWDSWIFWANHSWVLPQPCETPAVPWASRKYKMKRKKKNNSRGVNQQIQKRTNRTEWRGRRWTYKTQKQSREEQITHQQEMQSRTWCSSHLSKFFWTRPIECPQ